MRDLVIKNVLAMFPAATFVGDLQVLLSTIRPDALQHVPINATPAQAVNVIVDLAILQDWLPALLTRIPRNASNKFELDSIDALIAARPAPTSADPHEEVLLEGNRPFVNRRELRANLKLLVAKGGATLLLVNGQPKTGKTFSFYLAQHIARQSGFISSQFEVKKTPKPDELASEILDRIGANIALKARGPESAERWAEKLATQVKDAIEEHKLPRVFVFDDFPVDPQPPLPPETYSFIIRLARYSDQELPQLRVVLIQFAGTLPQELVDNAETDEAHPFTDTDMLTVLKQIRQARNWPVSDAALQAEIQALQATATLRDRFQLLKKAIRKLGTPIQPPAPAAPGGN